MRIANFILYLCIIYYFSLNVSYDARASAARRPAAAALARPLWNQLGHLIGTRITTNRFVKSALVKFVKHVQLPLLGSKLPPKQ